MKMEHPAFDILRADHECMRAMLAVLSDDTGRSFEQRAALLRETAAQLRARAVVEEELLVPAIRKMACFRARRRRIVQVLEDHRAAIELVLERTAISSLEFGGRTRVLSELLELHACEEEAELFGAALESHSRGEQREGSEPASPRLSRTKS